MGMTTGFDIRINIWGLTSVQTFFIRQHELTSGLTTWIDIRIDIIENATLSPYYNNKGSCYTGAFFLTKLQLFFCHSVQFLNYLHNSEKMT